MARLSADRCDLLCLDLPVAERLRQRRLEQSVVVEAASLAGALADPTRLAVATTLLDTDELCVCDLAWIAEKPQALVSHHARLLRERGLLRSRREGKMVLYSLTDEGRELLVTVLELAARSSARV
jgi:ArsR family transcriptional regulator, lead/cadmium/zinc/bismuth-responsive transcriptional repressor